MILSWKTKYTISVYTQKSFQKDVFWWSVVVEKKGEIVTEKLVIKISSVKMKEIKYCQFHRSTGNHYSSQCSRNPANLRNSRNAEKDNRRQSSSSNKKPTSSKHPSPKHPGKPEASKYQRKMKRLFSSSEDEKKIPQN